MRWFNAHDADAFAASVTAEATFVDHRDLAWEPLRGREDHRRFFRSALEISNDNQVRLEQVLAADDHVIAVVICIHGTAADGGGKFEYTLGEVLSFGTDGLVLTQDAYGLDQRGAMIARYAELGGGQGPLGEWPPELLWRRLARSCAARDLEGMAELCADDAVVADHRELARDPVRGRTAIRELFSSMLDALDDAWIEVDQVLACDERAVALVYRACGWAAEGGGLVEVQASSVTVLQNGLAVSNDLFAPGDCEATLARYEELRAAGHSAASWLVRHDQLLANDDAAALAELIDPGIVVRGRRGFPIGDRAGIEAYRELVGAGCATQLIASEGDFLLARRGEDPPLLLVLERRAGRLVEAIGLRDEARARAWLSALRTWRRYKAAARAGDLDGLVVHFHPDGRIVDRRPLQFQHAEGRDGIRAIYAGFGELLSNARVAVEVLEAYTGATMVSIRWSGNDRAGGGPVEWLTFHASRVDDGLYVESHTYADAESALVKLEELSSGAARARIARLYVEAFNAEDFDAPERLYTEDCVLVDHRPLGWKDVNSRTALVASYRSWKENQLGEVTVRAELLEDVGGTFFRQFFTGVWQGGTWEIVTETVNAVRDGRISRVETFGPDQVDARRARALELRAERSGGHF